MKAYGVKDKCDSDLWLRVGQSSQYSPNHYGSIRAGKKNNEVKNQLRRNMKRTTRQEAKRSIKIEMDFQ